jgi:hypothetical protein
MGESNRLQSFAEDLVVFRQLTTPEERTEFSGLMKRAHARHMSACAFVQRSPGRQGSAWIRRLCEGALSWDPTPAADAQDNPGGESADGTDFPR